MPVDKRGNHYMESGPLRIVDEKALERLENMKPLVWDEWYDDRWWDGWFREIHSFSFETMDERVEC